MKTKELILKYLIESTPERPIHYFKIRCSGDIDICQQKINKVIRRWFPNRLPKYWYVSGVHGKYNTITLKIHSDSFLILTNEEQKRFRKQLATACKQKYILDTGMIG